MKERTRLMLTAGSLALLLGGAFWWLNDVRTMAKSGAVKDEKSFFMTTNEIKWTSPDGKNDLETYRWDPGTLVVHQGDLVTIEFYGVKGASHPFSIEGYNVKGTVERGQSNKVTFAADKAGTFEIQCLVHQDLKTHGPMNAYLVVLPK